MKHICYHVLSDLHNEFLDTLEEVKQNTQAWVSEGDAHFKVYRLSAVEVEPDEIFLDEELISLEVERKN